ncbi:MAG: hypothetical protein AAF581_06925 [Planctomycetota bacterium]
MRRRSIHKFLPLVLALSVFVGCGGMPLTSRLSPPPLPDSVGNQVYYRSENKELKVQVGNFLSNELSKRYFLGELRTKGIMGVYMRIENRSPTRILVSNADCHLYGKVGESFVEIPQLPLADVAEPFLTTRWPVYAINIPFGIIFIPVFFSGFGMLADANRTLRDFDLRDSVIYENLIGVEWNKRAMGPGAIEKGVLFFDWEAAAEYRDELYLAIDMRDLVNDWHTVVPIKVKVVYDEGWFSTTYH